MSIICRRIYFFLNIYFFANDGKNSSKQSYHNIRTYNFSSPFFPPFPLLKVSLRGNFLSELYRCYPLVEALLWEWWCGHASSRRRGLELAEAALTLQLLWWGWIQATGPECPQFQIRTFLSDTPALLARPERDLIVATTPGRTQRLSLPQGVVLLLFLRKATKPVWHQLSLRTVSTDQWGCWGDSRPHYIWEVRNWRCSS